jgi:hypothetical protein
VNIQLNSNLFHAIVLQQVKCRKANFPFLSVQSWQELDQRLCSVAFLEDFRPLPSSDFRPPPSSDFRPLPSSGFRPLPTEVARHPHHKSGKHPRSSASRDLEKRASSEYRYRSAASEFAPRASEAKSVDLQRSGRRGSRKSSGQPTTSPTPTGRLSPLPACEGFITV